MADWQIAVIGGTLGAIVCAIRIIIRERRRARAATGAPGPTDDVGEGVG